MKYLATQLSPECQRHQRVAGPVCDHVDQDSRRPQRSSHSLRDLVAFLSSLSGGSQVDQYHSLQNHYRHRIACLELFGGLQLQIHGSLSLFSTEFSCFFINNTVRGSNSLQGFQEFRTSTATGINHIQV